MPNITNVNAKFKLFELITHIKVLHSVPCSPFRV